MLQSGELWVNIPSAIRVRHLDERFAQKPCVWEGRVKLVFTGTYEHHIDAKLRIAIPSELRSLFQNESAESSKEDRAGLYVTMGENQALCLYTDRGFDRLAEELNDSQMDPDALLEFEQIFYSLSKHREMDKQGRVRLPEDLLEMAGLGKDVVLIGVKDHLQIRDRQDWLASRKELLENNPRLHMNPRRAIGQFKRQSEK